MKYTKAELDRIAKECAVYLAKKAEFDSFFHDRKDKDDLPKEPPKSLPFVGMLVESRKRDVARRDGDSENVGVGHLSFHDYAGFMSELESAESEVFKAWSRIQKLSVHFELGELIPFDQSSHTIQNAYALLSKARDEIKRAKETTLLHHPPGRRELLLQRSAVELADAHLGATSPRAVRGFAKQIMLEAGLPEPDPKTITNWLREIRAQMGNSPLD